MSHELCKVARPLELNEVIGQDAAVKVLEKFVESGKVPHSLLFSGPSGCGKTTLARIMAEEIGCLESDLHEINAADDRGIDPVRSMRQQARLEPMGGGKARVWIVDEVHQLTPQAQQAFLKLLEDTPKKSYFFLCTSEPNKLLKTIHTRCTHIQVQLLKHKHIEQILKEVCKAHKIKFKTTEVIDKIIYCAEGSARKALVLLEQVYRLKDTEEMLEALNRGVASHQSIELARLLIRPSGAKWSEACKILKELDDEPETTRHVVMSYASNVLLGNNTKLHARAYLIITAFSETFMYSKNAGLVAACYDVLGGKG